MHVCGSVCDCVCGCVIVWVLIIIIIILPPSVCVCVRLFVCVFLVIILLSVSSNIKRKYIDYVCERRRKRKRERMTGTRKYIPRQSAVFPHGGEWAPPIRRGRVAH